MQWIWPRPSIELFETACLTAMRRLRSSMPCWSWWKSKLCVSSAITTVPCQRIVLQSLRGHVQVFRCLAVFRSPFSFLGVWVWRCAWSNLCGLVDLMHWPKESLAKILAVQEVQSFVQVHFLGRLCTCHPGLVCAPIMFRGTKLL